MLFLLHLYQISQISNITNIKYQIYFKGFKTYYIISFNFIICSFVNFSGYFIRNCIIKLPILSPLFIPNFSIGYFVSYFTINPSLLLILYDFPFKCTKSNLNPTKDSFNVISRVYIKSNPFGP